MLSIFQRFERLEPSEAVERLELLEQQPVEVMLISRTADLQPELLPTGGDPGFDDR